MRARALRDFVTRWWAGRLGRAGAVLDVATWPAGAAYGAAIRVRNRGYDRGWLAAHGVAVPVLSVGNLAVGGAGKTPVASWLLRRLRAHGLTPALLHGGYAEDEPALHRLWTPDVPVIAERDRVRGAGRALAAGANVIVLDDGFQHRRLRRDLDMVLIAAETWTDHVRLLPRRGWREPLRALERADVIAVTRRVAAAERAAEIGAWLKARFPVATIMQVWLRPAGWWQPAGNATAPAGDCLAVSALAHPAEFVANARSCGAAITAESTWPDHHAYDAADAAEILAKAGQGPIITSMKDWVKLARLLPPERVWVLQQDVVVEMGSADFEAALQRVLGR